MTDSELIQRFETYRKARRVHADIKRELEAEISQAYKQRQKAERELVDYMIENGIDQFGTADGLQPCIVKQFSIRCNKENKPLIRQWLLNTVGDDTDFCETSISKSAVLEHCKKLNEEGQDLPEFLGKSESPGLRVNGWEK